MKTTNLYVDLHVLQTVPPSCVNRDDTGSPKTAPYGGVTRARVSSQAWKRAIRVMFRDLFKEEQVGIRTKRVPELLAEKIAALNPDLQAKAGKIAEETLKKVDVGAKDGKTDALFFISQPQLDALAVLAAERESDKKKLQAALMGNPSVDIALFGRMVAGEHISLNYDAAAQVAHAISTHAVHNEYDYFTAVDDYNPEDNAGAGHLGTVEFNSSTLYRYATVNVRELCKNLSAGEALAAVRGFVEAFICSMPDGKQNTFANRTMPDMVYVTLRRDRPLNLSGAFEKPIPASEAGYVERSEKALLRYAKKQYATFDEEPAQAFAVGALEEWEELAAVVSLKQMLNDLTQALEQSLSEEEA